MAEADIATIRAETIDGVNTLFIDASDVCIENGELVVGEDASFNKNVNIGILWEQIRKIYILESE